jgi:type I restriction enzyme S subunit
VKRPQRNKEAEVDISLLNSICELRKETCSPHESNSQIYVGLEHIDSGRFFLSRHGSPAQVRSAKSRFYPGDVLYGKLRPYLDKAVVAETEGICSTDILVLEPIEVSSWFLCGVLHSNAFLDHAKQTTHGVNHPRTSWSGIKVFETLSLGLLERRKIAAVLLKIQWAIELQEKIIQSLRDLKKSTMQHLFTHGRRGEKTKMTKIGEIPENWELKPLGEMGRIGNGSTPKRTNLSYWDNGSVPWLTSGKIHEVVIEKPDQFVTAKAVEECHLPTVQKGGLLIAITGQGKTLGNAAIVTFDSTMSQHLAYVQPENPSIHPPYVRQYLTTCYQDLRRIGFGGGSTKGALTCADLRQYRIPLPQTIEGQVEIAQCLEAFDTKAILHESKESALQDLFKTTLNKLITGEIRVSDLDIDVSEVEG